jgi:hypothetical protein
MEEQRNEDALSEDMDPSQAGERPSESEPNPTQERMDEELEDSPHEGEQGQAGETA